MAPNSQQLIEELVLKVEDLSYGDETALDALRRRTEMVIRNVFGESSKYLLDLGRISFSPMAFPVEDHYYVKVWESGRVELRNLLKTMLEELQLFGETSARGTDATSDATRPNASAASNQIFVVHGHDHGTKSEVARFLEKLHLKPIILHEQPNSGNTVIEKFEHYSASASFAVVLLTSDDVGSAKDDAADGLRPRARQNVVFELGYFIGTLGRSNVAALCEPDVEIPSDYSGILYIQLDAGKAWQLTLAREIKDSGINVDMNDAI